MKELLAPYPKMDHHENRGLSLTLEILSFPDGVLVVTVPSTGSLFRCRWDVSGHELSRKYWLSDSFS
jgi:hypothetical protein